MKLENISIVGLGKLGATTMAVLASKGFNMVGIDVNKETVDKINNCEAPVYEPGLQKLLDDYSDRIFATMDYTRIADTDMTVIIVPTPSTETGGFSTEYVEQAVLETGRCIPNSKKYHNVVVTSTVLPGSMEEVIRPLLERCSNRKVGDSLGLCYNPDFIALGDIINGLLRPDMVLIGESDKHAGDLVEQMHLRLMEHEFTQPYHAPIHRMSLYNAELAKIALNAYVTMKISFANTIAEICEGMPTGNSEHVLSAIGSDTRIGKKYLRGALSYSGPCFPRDNRAFMFTATRYGSQSLLSQMTDTVNIQQVGRIVSSILKILSEVGTTKLAILGLTYKPDTVVTEESASLKIIEGLRSEGIKIEVYDPAKDAAYKDLPRDIVCWATPEACFDNNQVVFIATPWNEFKELKRDIFLNYMKESPVVIDAWGVQSQLQFDSDFDYRQIGMYYEPK